MQIFSPHYLTPAVCTKEQNDQVQESDAGASVGGSGQNQQCAPCSAILFPGHLWYLAGSRETIIVPFNPSRLHQETKALVMI